MLVLDGDVLPERKHRNDRSIDQAHTSVICARRLSDVGTNGSNPVHSGVDSDGIKYGHERCQLCSDPRDHAVWEQRLVGGRRRPQKNNTRAG